MSSDQEDPATPPQSREPAPLVAVRQPAAERQEFRDCDDRLVSAERVRAARRRDPVGQDGTRR